MNKEDLVKKYCEQLKIQNEEQVDKQAGWEVFSSQHYDLLPMDDRLLRCITENGLECYTPLCIQHPIF